MSCLYLSEEVPLGTGDEKKGGLVVESKSRGVARPQEAGISGFDGQIELWTGGFLVSSFSNHKAARCLTVNLGRGWGLADWAVSPLPLSMK